MSSKLPVFNIERFAIHDGEGIRTTVFFQGCPLHCLWCANPESQTIGKKIMFLSARCVGCGTCAAGCPQQAIQMLNGQAHIQRDTCIRCGHCADVCPHGAVSVSGTWMDWKEIFQIVIRDRAYYQRTDGGLTLSGGEALLHADRLLPMLEKCREQGISVAVETCGHVPAENVQMVLPWIDQFLFDVKAVDEKAFRQYTGGDLNLVLSNFHLIAASSPGKITARIPVIPQFNQDENSMRKIFSFVKSEGVRRVDLLPYHTLGISKYHQLGREYSFPVLQALQKKDVEPFCNIAIEDYDLQARME